MILSITFDEKFWQYVAYGILACFIIIALIGFTVNFHHQIKVSLIMDNETGVYNKDGLALYYKKKRKKFKNPSILVVELRNLSYIYGNYEHRIKMMYAITDSICKGLTKKETIGRVDFNKFVLLLDSKERKDLIELCHNIESNLSEISLEGYGAYNFNPFFGIRENVDLKIGDKLTFESLAILVYSTIHEGNIYFFSDEVTAALQRIVNINSQKDQALEEKRFVPFIQPKVDLKTAKIMGGEVLCRWVDSNQVVIYNPSEFIPLFENNGFIKKLELEMLDAACTLLQRLSTTGHADLVISVNISKVNFESPTFISDLQEIVSKHGVAPSCLELEITESLTMSNLNYVYNCIATLHQLGFKVAMDDFGKEYSSLSTLVENVFDTIKLDCFFFKNDLKSDKERLIVKNIINLLAKINCEIVCEGVETMDVVDYISTITHDIVIQGYVFSKPLSVPEFERFLDTKIELNLPDVIIEVANPQILADGEKVESQQPQQSNTSTSVQVVVDQKSQEEINRLNAQMLEMREYIRSVQEEQQRRELDFQKSQQEHKLQLEREKMERELQEHKLQLERERLERERNDHDRDRNRDSYRDRRDYDDLQQQIRDLRNQQNNNGPIGYPYPYHPYAPYPYPYPYPQQQQPQQNIDVDALIDKLSKKQKEQLDSSMDEIKAQNQSLQDRLDAERKEREELENMLKDIQTKAEEDEVSEEEQEREQEEADKALSLDVDALPVDEGQEDGDDDSDDADTDDENEAEEPVEKSELTLEQIEALVKNYQDRFQEDWMSHAKEELQGGFDELVKGLRFYKLQNAERKTFVDKVKKLSPEVKQIYNIVKNEFMKYNGVTNKLTNSCDVLYKGRNQIAKINFTKSKVRLYLGLDPNKEEYKKIPHKDLSSKRAHARTPFYMLLKSPLSVKRAKKLIADLMVMHNCEENLNYKPIDYATKYKFFKKDQKK